MVNRCLPSAQQRRRPFWATQPCGCGTSVDGCGNECCQPGLGLVDSAGGRTIRTEGWIQGLILNILNTEKRISPTRCGVNPAAVKGHWSESFLNAESGLYGNASRGYRVGTGLYQLDTKKLKTAEMVALIEATILSDLQKLVLAGVAQAVFVNVEYLGRRQIRASIEIEGPASSPSSRVALIGISNSDMGYYWSI